MRDDPSTQLHTVYSLFQTTSSRGPRLFLAVLDSLRDIFPASAPTLVIYAIRGRCSAQRLTSPGGQSSCTQADESDPRYSDFVNGDPLFRHGTLYLPFPSSGRPQGFLSLRLTDPQPPILSGLKFISQLVSTELRSQELRQEQTFQQLIADLDHALASLTDINQLLSASAHLL